MKTSDRIDAERMARSIPGKKEKSRALTGGLLKRQQSIKQVVLRKYGRLFYSLLTAGKLFRHCPNRQLLATMKLHGKNRRIVRAMQRKQFLNIGL